MALILKKHAERVYGSVHGGDYAGARALAKRLLGAQLEGGFTVRDVYAKGWSGLKDRDDVQRAASALVEHGWLVEHSASTGGRPTTRYSINPGIGDDLL